MKKCTVLICTPDMQSEITRRCLDSLFAHTPSDLYKLVVADNQSDAAFCHPHEINKQLDTLDTEFLVCLDDDVILTPGWLESLLAVAENDRSAGAVGCVHLNEDGSINHAGGWIHREGRGEHFRQPLTAVQYVPYVCSACVLFRKNEWRLDEAFKKYWHESEYCLRLWERGMRVAVAPHAVYHLVNRQMVQKQGRGAVDAARERDRLRFVDTWVNTGRIDALYDKVGTQFTLPEPHSAVKTPGSVSVPVRVMLPLLVRERMAARRDSDGGKGIALYGAGQHTTWLERILQGYGDGPKVMAVLDDHPEEKGVLFGCRVESPEHFDPSGVSAIVLSSDCHQQSMMERCRALYGAEVPCVDLYEGLPPGPYEKE